MNIISNSFKAYGLRSTQLKQYNEKYDVLLSFPDKTKPNVVQFVQNHNVLFMEPNEEWGRLGIESTLRKAAGTIARLQALQEMANKLQKQGIPMGGRGMSAQPNTPGGRGGAGTGHGSVNVDSLQDLQPYVAYSPPGVVQVCPSSTIVSW